jgi:nucleotide-binding universal stress UspA family protein
MPSKATNARLAYTSSWRVGEVAAVINDYVRAKEIDLVICGSHGHGALANLALGSIGTKLLATLSVPPLVVTREAASESDRQERRARGDGAH